MEGQRLGTSCIKQEPLSTACYEFESYKDILPSGSGQDCDEMHCMNSLDVNGNEIRTKVSSEQRPSVDEWIGKYHHCSITNNNKGSLDGLLRPNSYRGIVESGSECVGKSTIIKPMGPICGKQDGTSLVNQPVFMQLGTLLHRTQTTLLSTLMQQKEQPSRRDGSHSSDNVHSRELSMDKNSNNKSNSNSDTRDKTMVRGNIHWGNNVSMNDEKTDLSMSDQTSMNMVEDRLYNTLVEEAISRICSTKEQRTVEINEMEVIQYKCFFCLKQFLSVQNLQRHLVTQHSHFGGTFKCSCGDSFFRKKNFAYHLSLHGKDGISSCKYCKKNFFSVDALAEHLASHDPKKQKSRKVCRRKKYICKYCDKPFTHYFAWRLHVKSHSEAELFSCQLCNNWYLSLRSLSDHIITHMRDKKPKCPVCCKVFRFKEDYLNHQKENCSLMQIRCEKHRCYEAFFTWQEYSEHMSSIHHFRCTICGKSFSRWEKLQEHNLLHTGEKPRQCDICGKSFRTKQILKNHQRTHSEVKSFRCKFCEKSFTQKSALLRHERTHIQGVKDHCCYQCGKVFTQSCSLQRHLRIHTGERFKCTKCSATFIEAWRMRVHMKKKH